MNTRQKELLRFAFRLFPTYYIWKKKIKKQVDSKELEKAIRKSIKNVPYYHRYQELLKDGFDLKKLPIIRKSDILGHEREMVSTKVYKKMLKTVETGGSTGCSLSLSRYWKDDLIESVFTNYAFSLIGDNLIVGVLRGNKPKQGLFEVVSKRQVILSSYALCDETLDQYIDILNKYKISCLHVYPSSLVILTRLIKRKYGHANLPYLKGIFASSEIFSREDKQMVKEVFPHITLVDNYGHNELACRAYCLNDGYFYFYPYYGHVEFVDTGETINGNRIAEIVATSVMNTTMPFIRYATDDYAELDAEGNVVSIIGRTSDFLVNLNGEVTPCIVLTRNESMQNVTNFQFYQETVGKMAFRVVVNESFGEEDRKSLLEDLQNSFNGNMECEVLVVPSIERTKTGKQKRLDQKLNIREYL